MARQSIREFIKNGGPRCLPLSDLPRLYCLIGPSNHDFIIGQYWQWEHEQWAWDGLVSLLEYLEGREPPILKDWACHVLREKLTRPKRTKAQGVLERDRRIRKVYKRLIEDGALGKTALWDIGEAIGLSVSSIRKITDKVPE